MVLCGLFRDCMKGNSSSVRNRTGYLPVKMVETTMRSKYSSDLKSYKSACKNDISLKSFDSSLHERTNRVISSLSAQADTQSINQDSLMEVYEFILELNEDAVNLIVEWKGDVLKNQDLKSLIDVYFRSTFKTLDFCSTVEKCVKKTEISQGIIRLAVKQFESETVDTNPDTDPEGSKKHKYAKTLEQLYKFKATGDPFDSEFLTQYNSVYHEQGLLLDELQKLKEKLGKKQKNAETWRIISNVLFGAAFVAVLVFSVVAAAMISPPVVSAIASASTVLFQGAGVWISKMCKEYEKAVERQINLVSSTERQAKANKHEMRSLKSEVDNLRDKILEIMGTVDIAVERKENEEEMRLAMVKIKKQVDEFTKKIEDVGERADKCGQRIMLGRAKVLGDFFVTVNNGNP